MLTRANTRRTVPDTGPQNLRKFRDEVSSWWEKPCRPGATIGDRDQKADISAIKFAKVPGCPSKTGGVTRLDKIRSLHGHSAPTSTLIVDAVSSFCISALPGFDHGGVRYHHAKKFLTGQSAKGMLAQCRTATPPQLRYLLYFCHGQVFTTAVCAIRFLLQGQSAICTLAQCYPQLSG